jgi:hypothetical protein
MDQALHEASELLDTTRQGLYNYRVTLATMVDRCSAFEEAYGGENRTRIKCAQAYDVLYTQHERAVKDLHRMTNKSLSLEQELKDALMCKTEPIPNRNSIANADGDGGITQMDWAELEQDIAKEQLEARIMKLEDEKAKMKDDNVKMKDENAKMKDENEQALRNAVDHIHDVQRKFEALEQAYQASMTQAEPSSDQGGTPKATNSRGLRLRGGLPKKGRKVNRVKLEVVEE